MLSPAVRRLLPYVNRYRRAFVLGLVCVISVLSPERIVIGGGLMKRPGLLPRVHQAVAGLMNGYLDNTAMRDGIAGYITLPALGSKAGMLGAIVLAETA